MMSTSTKVHMCPTYDVHFTRTSNLLTHDNSVHDKTCHLCGFCGHTLGYINSMGRNMKYLHKEQFGTVATDHYL